MKKNYFNFSLVLLIAILSFTTNVNAQLTLPAGSPEASVTQRVGITDITIHYNRPYVKGKGNMGKISSLWF